MEFPDSPTTITVNDLKPDDNERIREIFIAAFSDTISFQSLVGDCPDYDREAGLFINSLLDYWRIFNCKLLGISVEQQLVGFVGFADIMQDSPKLFSLAGHVTREMTLGLLQSKNRRIFRRQLHKHLKTITPEGYYYPINAIAILPEAQGQGYGSRLTSLNHALDQFEGRMSTSMACLPTHIISMYAFFSFCRSTAIWVSHFMIVILCGTGKCILIFCRFFDQQTHPVQRNDETVLWYFQNTFVSFYQLILCADIFLIVFLIGLLLIAPFTEATSSLRFVALAGFLICIFSFLIAMKVAPLMRSEIREQFDAASAKSKRFLFALFYFSRSLPLLAGIVVIFLVQLQQGTDERDLREVSGKVASIEIETGKNASLFLRFEDNSNRYGIRTFRIPESNLSNIKHGVRAGDSLFVLVEAKDFDVVEENYVGLFSIRSKATSYFSTADYEETNSSNKFAGWLIALAFIAAGLIYLFRGRIRGG